MVERLTKGGEAGVCQGAGRPEESLAAWGFSEDSTEFAMEFERPMNAADTGLGSEMWCLCVQYFRVVRKIALKKLPAARRSTWVKAMNETLFERTHRRCSRLLTLAWWTIN